MAEQSPPAGDSIPATDLNSKIELVTGAEGSAGSGADVPPATGTVREHVAAPAGTGPELEQGASGASGTASRRVFKQTPDARPGPTGRLYLGKFYEWGKELPPEAAEHQTGRSRARPVERPEDRPGASGSGVAAHDHPKETGRAGRAAGAKVSDGFTVEELDGKTKDELIDLADAAGLTVTRSSGEGEPLKSDYVQALVGK